MIRPDELETALSAWPRRFIPALPGRRNHLPAGVMVPLRWEDGPRVLLTLRPRRMSRHGGEVSFPGGKPDPEDADIVATAWREAREELGIQGAQMLGRLSSMPIFTSDFRLEPAVAALPEGLVLRPSPDEVEHVFELSLEQLFEADGLDSIPWDWEGSRVESPIFPLRWPGGEVPLFGGTAYVLLELMQVVSLATGRPLPPWRYGRYSWEQLLGRPRGGA
jgi:8-oxo-dGTP pyrophosphatase MutT (NUDIX family)